MNWPFWTLTRIDLGMKKRAATGFYGLYVIRMHESNAKRVGIIILINIYLLLIGQFGTFLQATVPTSYYMKDFANCLPKKTSHFPPYLILYVNLVAMGTTYAF